MLVLSAMLAPASAGEAATSRACCEELLANTPPPQASAPSTKPAHEAPAAASTSMPAHIDHSDSVTFDAGPAVPMRRVAQMLPITPARPNSTSASDSVFGDGSSVCATNGAM